MANINRVKKIETAEPMPPVFGSGSCKYGTIGRGADGDLYIWTAYESKAINLISGTVFYGKLSSITSLTPKTIIELIVNEEQ